MEELILLVLDAQIQPTIQVVGLLLLRFIPLVIFTPVFGGALIPQRMHIGICLSLVAVFVMPFLAAHPTGWAWDAYVFVMLKELLIGSVLAFSVLVVFESFTMAGAIIDIARGASIANSFDQLSQTQQPLMAIFLRHLFVVGFLTIGGQRLLLGALGESYAVLPLGGGELPGLLGPARSLALIQLVGKMLIVGVRLATPVLIVMLLLDVSLGLMNRVAPQVQVFFLSLTIKGTAGILIVFLGFGVFGHAIVDATREITLFIRRLLTG